MDYDVILASYNGSKYIEEQILSILGQTVRPKAIYIRDDCSSDDTIAIIENIAKEFDNIILLDDNLGNLGYVKNFEVLVKSVRSKYFFFSDQDDIWLENKAETMLNNIIDENKSSCFSNAYVTDSQLRIQGSKLDDSIYYKLNKKNGILVNNFVTGATLLCKSDFVISLLPFPDGIPHDYWIAANSEVRGELCYVNNELIYYRQHDDNLIGSNIGEGYIARIRKSLTKDNVKKRKAAIFEKVRLLREINNRNGDIKISKDVATIIESRYYCYYNHGSFITIFQLFKLMNIKEFIYLLYDVFKLRKSQ
ncbi:N-glycosyltransferase [Vibrio chagasii]|uniref:glycosyltransferase n=1 Tax=unclassified Vibrio TaxID=2614977 RepID=UPI001493AE6A|nr:MULTISPECIES: glycosyltransferase [unclassified Vibrio]CAH6800210.1 N-glycosyltransferase [Vibrio chagasii]NOI37743.1 glycosyltransferase [Vibrio sp. 070316B]NOI85992.1 glycosyltransferase [Vibrio sp. 99K-1]CAH6859543.1 N-glycosyltransferase [Vibrio chagasii]CAH6868394.1 N-glycosyltransferase [Vibrio chagasii]